jgi:hypothetical protein
MAGGGRTRAVRRVGAVALLALAACGGALADGKSDYKKGRYPEAKEELIAAEADSRTWDEGRRAEYALYRGLVHAALGDRAAASLWLREAKAIEDAHPGTLSLDDAARLKLAVESTSPSDVPAPP